MVGARRFELLTPCAQGRCATRLRYAPTLLIINERTRVPAWQSLPIRPVPAEAARLALD